MSECASWLGWPRLSSTHPNPHEAGDSENDNGDRMPLGRDYRRRAPHSFTLRSMSSIYYGKPTPGV